MRYELTDYERVAIKPFLPNLPNKQRGVPRVDGRRVLNGIFWFLRSDALRHGDAEEGRALSWCRSESEQMDF